MSKLSENRAKIAQILADIEQLPEDRYEIGKEEGRSEGYEQGLTDGKTIGYENALAKRTDLVVEENGTYEPQGDSTGFKSVIVSVRDTRLNQYVNGTLTEVTAEDFQGSSTLRSQLFSGVTSLKRVQFHENLWDAGGYTFQNCTGLEVVDFSKCKKVRYLGSGAFENCSSLCEITIPKTVERGSMSTFSGCTSLSKIIFEDGSIFNEISSYMFRNCTSLTEITIQENVSIILSGAFRDCTSLKIVRLKPKTPPSIQANTFQGVHADCVYMVGYGCGDAYKSATNWSALANKIVEGDV